MSADPAIERTANWLDEAPNGNPGPQARWALVEIFGHRSHVGRISEVNLAGVKLLRIDVPIRPTFDNPDGVRIETFTYGGAAIFGCQLLTEAAAIKAIIDRESSYQQISLEHYGMDEADGDEGTD